MVTGPGLFRFIAGIDDPERPQRIEDPAAQGLADPVAKLVFAKGLFPKTAASLLDTLVASPLGDAKAEHFTFLAGDGGQLPASANVDRHLRFVIALSQASRQPEVLLSTSATGKPDEGFLQVVGWDDRAGTYNFYQRLFGDAWFWCGNSEHAIHEPSRGRGAFDSHVNGTLVMKELKLPWLHWHSSKAQIPADLVAEGPLAGSRYADTISLADNLELMIVVPAIRRSVKTRLSRASKPFGGELTSYLRHLFGSTTFNLATSPDAWASIGPKDEVRLPLTFFLGSDLLLDPAVGISVSPKVPTVVGGHYRMSVQELDLALDAPSRDPTQGRFRQAGDAHFAFVVPERALEDDQVVREMLDRRWLSERFVACVLMVDFPNPIFSRPRRSLLKHISESGTTHPEGTDASEFFASCIAKARLSDPAAAEFTALWQVSSDTWQGVFAARIEAYLDAVHSRLRTEEGWRAYAALAESRRREFARRPLREFCLTLPVSSLQREALEMAEDGTVRPKTQGEPLGDEHDPACV